MSLLVSLSCILVSPWQQQRGLQGLNFTLAFMLAVDHAKVQITCWCGSLEILFLYFVYFKRLAVSISVQF